MDKPLTEELKDDALFIRKMLGHGGQLTETQAQGEAWESIASRIELLVSVAEKFASQIKGAREILSD